MAEETATGQGTGGTAQAGAAAQPGQGRTYTQEEVDSMLEGYVPQDEVNRLVGSTRKDVRSKYEGYLDPDEAAEVSARAERAEAELAELKARAERQAAVAAVADKAGVPTEAVAMLNGADQAELAGQVKRLLRLLPGYPTRTDDGGGRAAAKKATAQGFAEIVADML